MVPRSLIAVAELGAQSRWRVPSSVRITVVPTHSPSHIAVAGRGVGRRTPRPTAVGEQARRQRLLGLTVAGEHDGVGLDRRGAGGVGRTRQLAARESVDLVLRLGVAEPVQPAARWSTRRTRAWSRTRRWPRPARARRAARAGRRRPRRWRASRSCSTGHRRTAVHPCATTGGERSSPSDAAPSCTAAGKHE